MEMYNCIFNSVKHEKRCRRAVSQLSQYLSDNSMTEYWEICGIMKIIK